MNTYLEREKITLKSKYKDGGGQKATAIRQSIKNTVKSIEKGRKMR